MQHPQEEAGLREWKPIATRCAPTRCPNSPGKAAPHRHRNEGANPPRRTAAPETTSREDNCREASRRRAAQGAGPPGAGLEAGRSREKVGGAEPESKGRNGVRGRDRVGERRLEGRSQRARGGLRGGGKEVRSP